MTGTINNGERLQVAFSFFTGEGGLARAAGSRDATVALRIPPVRGAYDSTGFVGGQPVEVISVKRSAVPGFVLVEVRFASDEPPAA